MSQTIYKVSEDEAVVQLVLDERLQDKHGDEFEDGVLDGSSSMKDWYRGRVHDFCASEFCRDKPAIKLRGENKIVFPKEWIEGFFKPVVDKIISHMERWKRFSRSALSASSCSWWEDSLSRSC